MKPILAAMLLATASTGAAQPGPSAPAAVPGPIERLKPGEFLWAAELSPRGPVTVVVSLPLQRAYVYRNGVPIAVSTVSTGKRGYRTPVGVFTILEKAVTHRSNLYDDAPMPFMQRLTWSGVALHAGTLPGHPASHGCIRLPREFAERLYGITDYGATVVVTDEADIPEIAPSTMALPSGDAAQTAFRWMPERSPSGPVSIVLSGRDRRVVVLRNGQMIGSAPVTFDAPVTATTAYVLSAIEAGEPRWLRLRLPGDAAAVPGTPPPPERVAGRVPDAFRAAVMSILTPGATLLITRETLASAGTGRRLRVMDAEPRR